MTLTNERVALVLMPFGPIRYPALGVSLLKAALSASAIPCDVHYFGLDLAAQIGFANYTLIAEKLPSSVLVGEWLFAPALFGDNPQADADYVKHVLCQELGEYITPPAVLELLCLRTRLDGFIEECFAAMDWSRYRVVGFSTSYQQNCASLALARIIKTHHPEIKIVFGGANCADTMGVGLARLFPFIDLVCLGEGDVAFPRLVQAIERDEPMPHIPGIFSRDSAVTSGPLTDMDSLPYPDYTDYFAQFKAHIGACDFQPLIPLETARGCWWAQIQPCTFCSLNSSSPIFRSKAPERVQDEISRLRHNYPGHSISVADTVLDYRYFKTLLPKLAAQQVHFIWETRTNFRREHFALMAQAGITQVQLGIESFSDAILRLMHKGATRIQNIQALKWCQQFGILASWNFLYGFPGEDPAEYVAMQNLTPLLFHLTAPWGWVHIRFERTSAYLNSPATYGVTRVSPSRAYQYVYHGLSPDQVAQIAYYFDAEYDDDSATYTQGVGQTVKEWQTRTDAALGVSPEPQSIRIVDTRTRGETREYHFDGLAAELYLLCDAAQSVRALMDAPSVRARAAEAEVVATLNQFVERGLMIREGKQYLSLAIVRDAALAASSTAQSQ